jgi:hypothetical protein
VLRPAAGVVAEGGDDAGDEGLEDGPDSGLHSGTPVTSC